MSASDLSSALLALLTAAWGFFSVPLDGLSAQVVSAADGSRIQAIRESRWERNGGRPQEHAPVPLGGEHGAAPFDGHSARGIYFTAGSVRNRAFFDKNVAAHQAAKGNAVIIDAKGSRVYFAGDTPYAQELGLVSVQYDLPEIIRTLHEKGMYVIVRFIAVKDDGITGVLPETMVKHPTTGRAMSPGWVDPSNEKALRYNGEVICALAAAGVDEINMDYIRFSTSYVGELGVLSGQQKADRLEPYFQTARAAIDRCGPSTKLGISTYAILGWNYDVNVETLGQDVKRFAKYVDVISPMAYPATFAENAYYIPGKHPISRMYYLVYRTLTGYQALLGDEHKHKLRPWIQGYSASPENIRHEMMAVRDAGLCGFTVWSAGNIYGNLYQALPSMDWPVECGM